MHDNEGEIILYRTDDGRAEIELHSDGDNVWLTQGEIARLFETTRANVTTHIKNIYVEGEMIPGQTRKESLPTSTGNIRKGTQLYNLPMILAIGYRVRSPRGVQFRQWATRNLAEYLVKGFVMDDERLKHPQQWDYFDELLARIRDIRASEMRFYQKVRDLFKLSSDYLDNEQESSLFFAEVQNKLLFAVTGMTAAEIVTARSDPDSPTMGLTVWKGGRVRKTDVTIAKNYLTSDEIDRLNRLVSLFLDQAEMRVQSRQQLTLAFWRENVTRVLQFSDLSVLHSAGSVSHEDMVRIAHTRYAEFDENRKAEEARAADMEDIAELERIEKRLDNHNSS